jgi:hypothetical protein
MADREMIGRTIGNYVVREKIGEGGMGVVYRAEHPHISRQVAIKVLHPGADRNPEVVHRFFNEARAATEIRNEHIVEVLDFGTLAEGTPYLVMEWLEGASLGSVLRSSVKLPVAQTVYIMRGIARALKAAHSKGVVHRDLKPDNVFLVAREGEGELVKVLDFGIAKLLATGAPVGYETRTGAIIGTPAYMSPEQCRGAKTIDHRTDIYALGVIGYQMLTGRLPFAADALGELLLQHMTEQPPAAATLEPSVPAALSDVLARAMEKAPEQRPSLAELMIVMDAVGGKPATADSTANPVGRLAVTPVPASPTPAFNTTLGAVASEVGIERRLPRARRGRLVVPSVIGVAAVIAAIVFVVTRPSSPSVPMQAVGVVATPSSALGIAPATASPPASIAVAIRTVPDTARLQVDGQDVSNPFARALPKDGRAHTVTATLAGFAKASHAIGFDRDSELVLKLVPDAAGGPRSTPGTSTRRPAGAHARATESTESGYRGSNLRIETEFPGTK